MAAVTLSSPEEAARDWAELPRDALLSVLHRLAQVDVLAGAGQVCCPWRQATQDEPELWRRVEVRPHDDRRPSRSVLLTMARAAVRRAAGRCETFCGEDCVDRSVLNLLGDTAPLLKSLRILQGNLLVDDDKTIKLTTPKFPLLEELELSLCTVAYPRTCEAVGTACPLLTRFRLNKRQFFKGDTSDTTRNDREAMAIATMRGLRSLQLFANPLSDRGLTAILDGCAHLKSLDIRHCFNVEMGGDAIRARCPGINTLRLPSDSTDDYGLKFSPPNMTRWNVQDMDDWHRQMDYGIY